MPTPVPARNPHAWGLAVAVAASGLLILGVLLPSQAKPSPPDGPAVAPPSESDPTFRVKGSGELRADRPTLREPGAPLSSAEASYATHLALDSMPHTARGVLDQPGGEVLLVELPSVSDRANSPGRRAVVSVHDYSSDSVHQIEVSLSERRVKDTTRATGLQLPPSAAETAVATDLALAAAPSLPFRAQYQKLTGTALEAAEQVRAVAGVWRADPSAPPHGELAACGTHRCLQLLIGLPSGHYLDTHDFTVDLSAGRVLRVPAGGTHEH